MTGLLFLVLPVLALAWLWLAWPLLKGRDTRPPLLRRWPPAGEWNWILEWHVARHDPVLKLIGGPAPTPTELWVMRPKSEVDPLSLIEEEVWWTHL